MRKLKLIQPINLKRLKTHAFNISLVCLLMFFIVSRGLWDALDHQNNSFGTRQILMAKNLGIQKHCVLKSVSCRSCFECFPNPGFPNLGFIKHILLVSINGRNLGVHRNCVLKSVFCRSCFECFLNPWFQILGFIKYILLVSI